MTRKNFVYVALGPWPQECWPSCSSSAAGILDSSWSTSPARTKGCTRPTLQAGEVVARSNPIEGMGWPTSVVFVAETSRLYIGSRSDYARNDYYPLIAVDVSDEFDVAGRYTLYPEHDTIDPSTLKDVDPIYKMVASETSDHLYLMYASPDYGGRGSAIFDMTSERIVGKTGRTVLRDIALSPDGSQAAYVWPTTSRDDQWRNHCVSWRSCGLGPHDGEIISQVELEDSGGLQPPWEDAFIAALAPSHRNEPP